MRNLGDFIAGVLGILAGLGICKTEDIGIFDNTPTEEAIAWANSLQTSWLYEIPTRLILERDLITEVSTGGSLYLDKDYDGEVSDYDEFLGYTLELPFRNNERFISCIPAGTYELKRRATIKYDEHFLVRDVPNREFVLIHRGGTSPRHTKGCILLGNRREEDRVYGSHEVMANLRDRFYS